MMESSKKNLVDLTTSELLTHIDVSHELELYDIIQKLQINGFILKNLGYLNIKNYIQDLPTILKFEIFCNRVRNKFESLSEEPKQTTQTLYSTNSFNTITTTSTNHNELELPDHIISPNTTASLIRALPSATNSPAKTITRTTREHNNSDSSSNGYSNWPKKFEFPIEKLSQPLKQKLNDPDIKITNKEENEIVHAVFTKMLEYNLDYPKSHHYTEACLSIVHSFPHLSSSDTSSNSNFENFKIKLKRKFTHYRNKELSQTPTVIEAKKKFTPNKRKISAVDGHNNANDLNSNDLNGTEINASDLQTLSELSANQITNLSVIRLTPP